MTGGWSLAHFQDVVHLWLVLLYPALKLGSLKVIAAHVGLSPQGNFILPVLVKDIPPRSLIASRSSNKSNLSNSPSTIKTSTTIGSVVSMLSSTTPSLQLFSALLLTVSMWVSFCFHSWQHCLQANDFMQPVSTRASHSIPLIWTVPTGSAPFMCASERRLALNSRPFVHFPDRPGQCVPAAGIDSMWLFFGAWHLSFWKFQVAGDRHVPWDWVHHTHGIWSAYQFSSMCNVVTVLPLPPAPHCWWNSSVFPRLMPALVVDPSLPSGRMLVWAVQHAQATQQQMCIVSLLLTYLQTDQQVHAIQPKRHQLFLLAISDALQIVSMQWRGLRWMPYSAFFTAYAPPDRRIRITDSICFTPLNWH